jgi:hypothetical protein
MFPIVLFGAALIGLAYLIASKPDASSERGIWLIQGKRYNVYYYWGPGGSAEDVLTMLQSMGFDIEQSAAGPGYVSIIGTWRNPNQPWDVPNNVTVTEL